MWAQDLPESMVCMTCLGTVGRGCSITIPQATQRAERNVRGSIPRAPVKGKNLAPDTNSASFGVGLGIGGPRRQRPTIDAPFRRSMRTILVSVARPARRRRCLCPSKTLSDRTTGTTHTARTEAPTQVPTKADPKTDPFTDTAPQNRHTDDRVSARR